MKWKPIPTAFETVDGAISPRQFQSEMLRADAMRKCDTDNAEFWTGYQRGLRRAFHGENFGTAEEHNLWLSLVDDADPMRRQRGRGYHAGLNFGKTARLINGRGKK
jgi:hypothetical protein